MTAGTYTADPHHTQVAWTINHLGFNVYHGLFGNPTGTLKLDPAHPAADRLTISFPIADAVTTVPALNKHIAAPDMMDAAKYPTGSFEATATINRGDFGINYLLPALGNRVDLAITAAFEKK